SASDAGTRSRSPGRRGFEGMDRVGLQRVISLLTVLALGGCLKPNPLADEIDLELGDETGGFGDSGDDAPDPDLGDFGSDSGDDDRGGDDDSDDDSGDDDSGGGDDSGDDSG